jgi:hypothetical protein
MVTLGLCCSEVIAMQTIAVVFTVTAAVVFGIVAIGIPSLLQFMILIVDDD